MKRLHYVTRTMAFTMAAAVDNCAVADDFIVNVGETGRIEGTKTYGRSVGRCARRTRRVGWLSPKRHRNLTGRRVLIMSCSGISPLDAPLCFSVFRSCGK